jgi:hypothetical protein
MFSVMTQNIPSLEMNATQFIKRWLNSINTSVEFGESCNGCCCATLKVGAGDMAIGAAAGRISVPGG